MKNRHLLSGLCLFAVLNGWAQSDTLMTWHAELSGNAGSGDVAPLWFTANRNGLSSANPNSGYLRAGIAYGQHFNHGWHIGAGVDLAGAVNAPSKFIVQQAYADFSWRCLNLSVGSKERTPFLYKNPQLTSGWLVEGYNTRPIPQVRAEIADYFTVPGTKGWFAFKGHIAYGRFVDDRWQRDFSRASKQKYVEDVLYHSKALMLRFGNKDVFPLEAEVGMLMAAQFGGKCHRWNGKGEETVDVMPSSLKHYAKVFLARTGGEDTPGGDQVNVEGNHVGSWNVGLNYYLGDWKFRVHYEHFFDDHSQMFFEYGRWKDGQLGIEVYLPENRVVSSLLWEGIATKDQTGPILYDGDARFEDAVFSGTQISAKDNYYNNYFYQSWQHYGLNVGCPLLPGPLYNEESRSMLLRSNRMRANHWGFEGDPSDKWHYRVLMSYALHWGTYDVPLDKVRNQFSSLYEATYSPRKLAGWSFSLAAAVDHGDYIGNSAGGMLTIRKEGVLWKRK